MYWNCIFILYMFHNKINLPIARETPNTPLTLIVPMLCITVPPAFRIL